MIGGQNADIEAEEQAEPLTTEQILFIHANKTAALIQSAMTIGATLAGATDEEIAALELCAYNVGIAFQIQDDILDVIGDSKELGKATGSDAQNHKQTYVTLHGLEESGREVERLTGEAVATLDSFSGEHEFLKELLLHLVHNEIAEEKPMLLDKIEKANDIKKIDKSDYGELAEEIRQFLIEKISVTGGHLGSNLGAVELTMALHLALNLPEDKIIWDVGHQSYTHKILTGRKDGFDVLRQFHGMSGFPKRKESDYDAFDTGHSSTSISAGLGLVKARDTICPSPKMWAVFPNI